MADTLSRPQKKITIRTIAEKLDLSPATVSLVLSGQAEKRGVAQDTAKRVRQAAEALDYVPNHWARRLRNQRSGVISLIVPDLRYDFAQKLLQGIQPILKRYNFLPFIATHDWDQGRQEEEIISAVGRRDEGIICLPLVGSEDIYEKTLSMGVPTVFVCDTIPGQEQMTSVRWDSYQAATRVVQYLIDKGRRRIGFVGYKHLTVGHMERFDAYKHVLEQAGLEFNEDWVYWTDWVAPPRVNRTHLAHMFRVGFEAPDALFVINDSVAYPLLNGLSEIGISVPEEVAVISMCDLPLSCEQGAALTTIREPLEAIGGRAAELLVKQIEQKGMQPVHEVIPGNELIVRQTA